jgi:hypothetical protein
VIFNSGFIIGPCGVDFGIECSQSYFFAIKLDLSAPLAAPFDEIDALKLRRSVFPFSQVAAILKMSCETEISPAIVEGVVVSMVNEKTRRGIHNFPVEADVFSFARACFNNPSGIEFFSASIDNPFELAEAVVNVEVNDCPVALAQIDFAEGVAEAEKAIDEQGTGENEIETVWNFDLDSCHFISSFFLATDFTDYTDLF